MAERRMFSKTIVDSDQFLDLPMSAQALYFHLAMRADDEGFVNNPRRIMRMIGASDCDCRLLIEGRFIICFDSGIVVIRHWRVHNYVQRDRFKPTQCTFERAALTLDDSNVYTMDTDCIQDGYSLYPQDRLGKESIGKDRLGESGADAQPARKRSAFVPPTTEDVRAYCAEIGSSIDPQHFVDYYTARGWKLAKGTAVKDWKACLRTWEAREKKTPNGGERYAPTYKIDEAAELAAFVEEEDDG